MMTARFSPRVTSRLDVATWGKSDSPWFKNVSNNFSDSSGNITVTCGATAHTKGAYTQLIASTSNATNLLILTFTASTSNVNTATLVDIAVGAAGSETTILGDIAIGGTSTCVVHIPIEIPVGTRISARGQSIVTGGKTFVVSAFLASYGSISPLATYSSFDVLGTDTATSVGTNLTTSYTELISATPHPYSSFVVIQSCNGINMNSGNFSITVGIGAAGSESDLGSIACAQTNTEQANMRNPFFPSYVQGPIPEGSRIAVKASTVLNSNTLSVCLIGIPFV